MCPGYGGDCPILRFGQRKPGLSVENRRGQGKISMQLFLMVCKNNLICFIPDLKECKKPSLGTGRAQPKPTAYRIGSLPNEFY
jgi:hypothetical protein